MAEREAEPAGTRDAGGAAEAGAAMGDMPGIEDAAGMAEAAGIAASPEAPADLSRPRARRTVRRSAAAPRRAARPKPRRKPVRWSARREAKFLEALANSANVAQSLRTAGLPGHRIASLTLLRERILRDPAGPIAGLIEYRVRTLES